MSLANIGMHADSLGNNVSRAIGAVEAGKGVWRPKKGCEIR